MLARLAPRRAVSFARASRSVARPASRSTASTGCRRNADIPAQAAPPTRRQLTLHAVHVAIPFVGLGFLDNVLMLTAGDAIDESLGRMFVLSTLACAGLGNAVGDVAGTFFGQAVEQAACALGLPAAELTPAQLALRAVRTTTSFASAGGIFVGCIMGLFPLLWIDSERRKVQKVFTAIDIDGDGRLSVDEITFMLKRILPGAEITKEQVVSLISVYDANEDGVLDFDEFYAFYTKLVGFTDA